MRRPGGRRGAAQARAARSLAAASQGVSVVETDYLCHAGICSRYSGATRRPDLTIFTCSWTDDYGGSVRWAKDFASSFLPQAHHAPRSRRREFFSGLSLGCNTAVVSLASNSPVAGLDLPVRFIGVGGFCAGSEGSYSPAGLCGGFWTLVCGGCPYGCRPVARVPRFQRDEAARRGAACGAVIADAADQLELYCTQNLWPVEADHRPGRSTVSKADQGGSNPASRPGRYDMGPLFVLILTAWGPQRLRLLRSRLRTSPVAGHGPGSAKAGPGQTEAAEREPCAASLLGWVRNGCLRADPNRGCERRVGSARQSEPPILSNISPTTVR